MNVSKSLLNTINLTLKAIFGASNADIRAHGTGLIPKGPVLFVVNHFTRVETVLMPYIIKKYTGKNTYSLAHYSFFGGSFGNFMNKLGAISTRDPNRDKIFIKTLLTGELAAVIFPEGQMIKDKKIIERGKYLIYNAGVVRPPHTGAARLALRAEFYRRKIKKFLRDGNAQALDQIKKYFNMSDKDIILSSELTGAIVPVNITYYPMRARMNALTKLAGKLMKKIPARMEEELEVEGSILFNDTDIDLNFGSPIFTDEYLKNNSEVMMKANDSITYLEEEIFAENIQINKISVDIMKKYMDSIYGLTTINHDHIFSFITAMYPKAKMPDSDLRARTYFAIKEIQNLKLINQHTSLSRKQKFLVTDDYLAKYRDFIKAGVSDDLITVEKENIIINKKRFNVPYNFHSIRKDNIIEVCKNEIEPQKEAVRILNRIMMTPPFVIRRRLRKDFTAKEQVQFEKDYSQFYNPKESKDKNIGRPFLLKHFWPKLWIMGDMGVILVHGYMAAPEEVRPMAEYLYKKGLAVYCARMSGHGTSPDDLATRTWEDWYDSVNRAYVIMKNSYKKIAIVGFSTGSGIALFQAANKENRFSSVISINAPLLLHNFASAASPAVNLWNKMLGKLNIKKGQFEFAPNHPENPAINYTRNPISGVNELKKLMKMVELNIKRITAPVLIIQGSNDPVVKRESASKIFDGLKCNSREIVEINSDRHCIIRGPGSEHVFEKVYDFLIKNFKRQN